MRTPLAVLLLLSSSTAIAGGSRGETGGGRLGSVSAGMGKQVGSDQGSGTSGTRPVPEDRYEYDDGMYRRRMDGVDIIYVDSEERVVRRITPPRQETNRLAARIDLFLGVQKVVESETAFNASLAISDDWFRLAGTVARYWEQRADGNGKLTMTTGSLTLGIPLQQGGGSRAYLEGGVVLAKTANDPTMDTSITGGKVGLHLEQPVKKLTFVGDIHGHLFESDIRAYEARLGVRYGKFEGALRVLDYNVGPALYGPEIGVAF